MTAVRNTVILGPSRMMGNYHVRFLEEGNPVRGCPYSTESHSARPSIIMISSKKTIIIVASLYPATCT